MNLNFTLFGEMITFALFVMFTLKYVWPPIIKALEERKHKIAEGLAAGERGEHQLELAKNKAAEMLRDVKVQAADILELANKRSAAIIDEAKDAAIIEGQRIVALAQSEIAREVETAKYALRQQIGEFAVSVAEKILSHHIDAAANQDFVSRLVNEIYPATGDSKLQGTTKV